MEVLYFFPPVVIVVAGTVHWFALLFRHGRTNVRTREWEEFLELLEPDYDVIELPAPIVDFDAWIKKARLAAIVRRGKAAAALKKAREASKESWREISELNRQMMSDRESLAASLFSAQFGAGILPGSVVGSAPARGLGASTPQQQGLTLSPGRAQLGAWQQESNAGLRMYGMLP